MPRIVVGLHPNPNPGAPAKQLAYTHGNFRRNRLFLFHYVMKVLPRDAEQASDLGLRFARCREHILPNYRAGMDRAPIGISLGDIFGHFVHSQQRLIRFSGTVVTHALGVAW
jgi:hypothetical protein